MPEQITINLGHVWLAVKVVAGILIARQEFKYPFFQGGVETVRPLHVVLRRVLRNIAVNPEWGIAKLLAFIPVGLLTGKSLFKHFLPWSISPKCPNCKDKGWYYKANFVKPGRTRRLVGLALPSVSHSRIICDCKAGEAEQSAPVVQSAWQQTVGICVNCDKPLPSPDTCTCVEEGALLYKEGSSWLIDCSFDFAEKMGLSRLMASNVIGRCIVYINSDGDQAHRKWMEINKRSANRSA